MIKVENSYCNTTSQSVFVSFTMCMARPLLKLKRSILLVMYSWLKGIHCEMNGKYSITLLFFDSNSQYTSLLRPACAWFKNLCRNNFKNDA